MRMSIRRRARKIQACLLLVIIVGCIFYLLQLFQIATLTTRTTTTTTALGKSSVLFLPEKLLKINEKRMGPIFYNIFIPINDIEKEKNALRIVREQLQQLQWSAEEQEQEFSRHNTNKKVNHAHKSQVWYTLIGGSSLSNGSIVEICQQQQPYYECHNIGYNQQGDEVDTLQALYEYCQDHPEKLVTYIHDKGSFHSTEHNEQTRRTATKAALDCRSEMMKHDDLSTFNVCTSTMIILPQYLSKANMWSAKCSFIRNLIPPIDYETAMKQMYNETILHPILGTTEPYSCLKPIHMSDNHLGLGRYAYERWVWSHPDVIPADVIPFQKIDFAKFPPTWKPSLARSLKGSPRRMDLHRGFGISSFARLEGRLLEWKYLYHKEPNNSSWIWDYYKGYETGSPAFKVQYCGSTQG